METSILTGILMIAAGAFTAGSFAIPFGKVRSWKWETYWLIYCIGAYTLFPLLSCLIFAPGFVGVYQNVPANIKLSVFLLGAVYGIGNLSFGLSLRYLGISLGYAMSLGLMLAIGTLIPPLIDGRLIQMLSGSGGNMLITGVVIACIGIGLSGWAGHLKDSLLSDSQKKEAITEFNFIKGVLSALLVGITGSAMSLGLEQSAPISKAAEQAGVDPLFSSLPVMLLLLSGTLSTTIIYCIWSGYRNKSLSDYYRPAAGNSLSVNYIFSLLAGLLWFSQFILFGMGKSKMGPYTFTSWGILMGLTIVCAFIWGFYRKEWRGAPLRIILFAVFSLIIVIVSSCIIGISGSV
jgi:L-rhamnose-H+ transport protein